jgi:hypothetical protein
MLEDITENAKAGSKMEDLKIKVSSLHGWDYLYLSPLQGDRESFAFLFFRTIVSISDPRKD